METKQIQVKTGDKVHIGMVAKHGVGVVGVVVETTLTQVIVETAENRFCRGYIGNVTVLEYAE